jgi:uncharacterized Tic20 family protein
VIDKPDNNMPEQTDDQGVRIPVTPHNTKLSEVAPEVESLVREYEQRYGGFRNDESPEVRKAMGNTYTPPKMKRQPIDAPRSVTTVENERLWAGLAHASALLTLLIAIPTGGIGAIVTLFIPLMIYLYYRERSQYVAFHAAQAFALQAVGTVGWLAAVIVATLAAVILTVVLSITIVGILVVPFLWLAWLLLFVASFALPLGMVVFGIIGAWEGYQGKWYRVPFIGLWIERQMNGGFLRHS